jgi:hypothetical protein
VLPLLLSQAPGLTAESLLRRIVHARRGAGSGKRGATLGLPKPGAPQGLLHCHKPPSPAIDEPQAGALEAVQQQQQQQQGAAEETQ